MYKRILLKLSGEQLAGKFDSGIDAEFCGWLAREVKQAADHGTQVVIMVGGGNYARGAQLAGHGIKRVTADHVGMLATLMNAIALTDIFEAQGVATRCLSNIYAEQVAESFSFRLAEKHLQAGRVVIVAGGIGRPYLTTDTAAVSLALEMDCQIVVKATKVDGVYTKDPEQHEDAEKIEKLSYEQAVEDPHIRVMDKAAMALAMDHSMGIVVFDATVEKNIARVAAGEAIGTLIS
ncbi:UMP kinase [Candidatus Saccharibacteria bacterium]|nr:UMP kinase [Candidatus Saccharibacteria bacterium]